MMRMTDEEPVDQAMVFTLADVVCGEVVIHGVVVVSLFPKDIVCMDEMTRTLLPWV